MSLLGGIAGKVLSTAAGSLVGMPQLGGMVGGAISSSIGGKKGGKQAVGGNAGLVPFRAGGLKLRYDWNGSPLVENDAGNPARLNAINSLKSLNTQQAGQIRSSIPGVQSAYEAGIGGVNNALTQVSPGFGALTKARIDAIQNAGRARGSDLRASLARRRVLGSSFADDAMSRQSTEVAQQEADARAQSFLEELDMTTKLIDTRLNYHLGQIQDVNNLATQAFAADKATNQLELDEQNVQLGIVTGMLQSAMQIAQGNAQYEANNAVSNAGSQGFGIGSLMQNTGGGVDFNSGQAMYGFNRLFGSGTTTLGSGEKIAWS